MGICASQLRTPEEKLQIQFDKDFQKLCKKIASLQETIRTCGPEDIYHIFSRKKTIDLESMVSEAKVRFPEIGIVAVNAQSNQRAIYVGHKSLENRVRTCVDTSKSSSYKVLV